MIYQYKNQSRIGDHKCYYSNLTKMRKHYPKWEIRYSLKKIFEDIIENIHINDNSKY